MKAIPRYPVLAAAILAMVLPSARAAEEEPENWQVGVTLGKDGWLTYRNARFGSTLPIPPGMKALRPPDNGGGQAFASLDGKVKIVVGGHFNVDGMGSVEESWKAALAEKDRTITYKKKTAEWYVVSGTTKDGSGFYEKYVADAKYCAGWSITYPQADEKKYVPWIERMAKDFQPNLGKGDDTVE
ncbi:hypothetical protein [Luteolibacter sp. LG18]|uniref:hypothetical protein n=1 Tax=Luteolibacter sp. LG18 TaxID=2819286 RepID=UPI002B2EB779|nr:hypothetical protein llg_36670 [Luteolibacter sp. LG18]